MANSVKSISEFFDGNDTYKMPLYQRTYCWRTIKELKQFKTDIEEVWEAATNNEDTENFLGAIILQELKEPGVGRGKTFNVIDGQQRLTTIYFMLLASADYAKERGWHKYADKIRDEYIVHTKKRFKGNVKIYPTNHDRKQFNQIISLSDISGINKISNASGGNKDGEMTAAYTFIKTECVKNIFEKAGESEDDLVDFTEAFTEKFVLADITIDEGIHDANEVFNRLNTEGLELGVVDIIRNNLFMGFTNNTEAENFHKNKWVPFEESLAKNFGDINHLLDKPKQQKTVDKLIRQQAEDFFFPYATNFDKTIRKKHLADSLRTYWKKRGLNNEQIINDMDEYLEPYLTWIPPYQWTRDGYDIKKRINSSYPDDLKNAIISLKQLKVNKDMLHFLVRILHEVNKKRLSAKKAAQSIKLIESHFIRRALAFHAAEAGGTGMQQKFINLWSKTGGDPKKVKDFFNSSDKDIPNDTDFRKGIETAEIYNMERISRFIIFKYEKYLSKIKPEVYPNQHIKTIDHINPQSHNEKGNNKIEYEETLHLLGNLLPMSKELNASKGCRKIDQELKDELNEKSMFVTTEKWLKDQKDSNKWKPQDIKDRTKKMANWAVKEWKV